MNNEMHMQLEEHSRFCEFFLKNKRLTTGSVDESFIGRDKDNNTSQTKVFHGESRESRASQKMLKYKKQLMHVIKLSKKKKPEQEINKPSIMEKKATLFSESRKKRMSEVKTYNDLQNLPPVVHNNIKMFINKLKRIGYLNDLSVLKPQDLEIINDRAYFEPEGQIGRLNLKERFKDFKGMAWKLIQKIQMMLGIRSLEIPVIQPYSTVKLFWDMLLSLLTVFLMFYIPLTLSFGVSIMNDFDFKFYVLLILLLDIILEINTFYFHYGSEVRDRYEIFKNYLKSYFIPDLMALFPYLFEFSFFDFMNPQIKQVSSLFFLMKISCLIKFGNKMTNRFQFSHESNGVIKLIYLFFIIILITHFAACGWYYIGVNDKADDILGKTWIKDQSLTDEEWYIKYMSSFYWSIVTVMTVGYGDITPQNYLERCFCLFVILFGGMMFPYSINSIGLIIQDMQREQKKFDNTLDVINAYMRRKNVNSDLQTRIREYLKFIWREEKSQNMDEEKKIIDTLSHSLKEELNLESYGFFLKNNPLFTKFFSEHSLKKLVTVMKEIFLTPDDVIFLQNQTDQNPAIYFIGKGKVKVYSEQNNKSLILLKELKEGDYFGERSFFTNFKRENTTISDKFSSLFMITQDDFIATIKENRYDYVKYWEGV